MKSTPRVVLADILPRDNNQFDLIRLVAAIAVIFGHSFYLFPTGGQVEPITRLVERNFTGTLAVGTFFFLSGILVTQSYARSAMPMRFLLMRAARIYPGALVCLLIVSLLIGPAFSSLPIADYLRNPKLYCYLAGNWSFLSLAWLMTSCSSLPGLFEGNRIGNGPNGSLWTLYPELACYLYVLVLGLLGSLKTRGRILAALAGLLIWHAWAPHTVPFFSNDHYTDVLKVSLFFLAGVAAYAMRDSLVLRASYLLPLVIAAALVQRTAVQEYALYAALFYAVLEREEPTNRIPLV